MFSEILVFIVLILVIAISAVIQAERNDHQSSAIIYGATFSTTYADNLGLDPRRAYLAVIDELGLRHIRLPVYWSDVEPTQNIYAWDELDWMIDEAAKRGVNLTLVIGRKVPRWPECYVPDWAEKLASNYQNQALLDFLENVVRRYETSPAVSRYQVENEPFYNFGECPTPDANLFDRELALVRQWSDKPIQLTVSGENEFWVDTAIPADILGVSMYRATWSQIFGYWIYPMNPDYYGAKALAVAPLTDAVIVSELQAEPWFRGPLKEADLADLVKEFTPEDLARNIQFAKEAGFDEVYFWGVEYWYWLSQKGEPALWDAGKELIQSAL